MSNEIKKCPHCGYIIEHFYNHKCPYCRQMLYVTDDRIKEFNNCDLKIRDVTLDRNPISAGWIVTVYAFSYPKVQWFEEETSLGFITSGDDVGKPVGYRLAIPMEMIAKGDYDIIDFIIKSLPPIFEKYSTEILHYLLQNPNIGRVIHGFI